MDSNVSLARRRDSKAPRADVNCVSNRAWSLPNLSRALTAALFSTEALSCWATRSRLELLIFISHHVRNYGAEIIRGVEYGSSSGGFPVISHSVRGPILLPTAVYTPCANIEAFLAHLTRCVYALYLDVRDWKGEDIAPPFDVSRLNKMAKQLCLLPQEPFCITRVCLLCLLHKQNLNAQYKRPVDTYDPCLILTGEAERYMVDAVGNYREASTGTTVLYPTWALGP